MIIELRPETEEIVKQALASGRFQSVDEMILEAVQYLEPKDVAVEARAAAFAKLRAFANSLEPKDLSHVDDSREAIYGTR